MTSPASDPQAGSLEAQVQAWRTYLRRRPALASADVDELEDHLREQMASLRVQGLSADEAFLVAVKRLGATDALTREFALEHSDRVWKQLVLSGRVPSGSRATGRVVQGLGKSGVALVLAVGAAVAIRIPAALGIDLPRHGEFYFLNFSFFTLPFITAYFAWDRLVARSIRFWLLAAFGLAAVIVNLFPYFPSSGARTELLTALHLPIVLWLVVGVAYVGGRWPGSERRMDFIRFTGEAFICYILIALGGVVLIGLTYILFEAIGLDASAVVGSWIVPCGMAGATVAAAWLVERKPSVIENMAPVLARIFSPLFAALLLAFLVAMLITGRGINPVREVLIGFDLLLVVVFGLLLYSISARDALAAPGLSDWGQLILVVTALLVDVLALWAIGSRIFEFGVTANKVAALGENLIVLVSLAGSAVLYGGFVRGRVVFSSLSRWQTTYLDVLAGWAVVVAFLLPPLFDYT